MARIPHVREKFDLGRKLIALKPFAFSGRNFQPGEPFDRTLTTTRRLRQLYDAHFVTMSDEQERPLAGYINSSDSELLELSIMGIEELTEFLRKRGHVPRYGSTRIKLVQKAEQVLLAERKAAKVAA